MKRALIFATVLGICSIAGAQKNHKKAESAAPQMPPQPQSVEMKKMTDTFAGLWKATTTVEPGGFMPQGGTATGRADIRSGPAGNSLSERFRSHGAFGNFAGSGTIWWDLKAAAYRALWCDTMAPSGCDMVGMGKWEGNNLVFTGETEMEGKKVQMRETYSDITPDSFTFVMETGTDGAPMQKAMTIKYERATPKSASAASTEEKK
jgi:hypothetical protein